MTPDQEEVEDPTPPDVRVDLVEEDPRPVVAPVAPDAVREVESKLRVHALFRLPDLTEALGVERVAPQSVRDLLAVYHDTDDLALFRWRARSPRTTPSRTRSWPRCATWACSASRLIPSTAAWA